jgi:hypothetical protein
MSDDDEDSSTDDDFLAYLLDDDDDDDYDDDVALFSLVGAYITELSRKSCVQRRLIVLCQRSTGMGDPCRTPGRGRPTGVLALV